MNSLPSQETPQVGLSVVIPTYQRCAVVLASVQALTRQTFNVPFEVIVVVDGSQDGSAEALRALQVPFFFQVIEQPNQGAAAARNRGASVAQGDILLFLDDDMEADPHLLEEHARSHREGADVVLGHIPLHPDSPPGLLNTGVKSWAEKRAKRLAAPGATLTLHDLLTGQISLHRAIFQALGGFDTAFTHGGSFGNEDVDFGYRLLRRGYKIVFNPHAISWQYYVVQPRHYLRQWRQAGQADVVFARKHPDQANAIFAQNKAQQWTNRYLWRPLATLPVLANLLIACLRWLVVSRVERGAEDGLTARLFYELKAAEYWRGVHEAGGLPAQNALRVLAYHAIRDLAGEPILEPYGMPPALFARQLDALQQAGYHFVSGEEVLRFLQGQAGLPRNAVLLTFDDGYEELLADVLPMLTARAIPAIVFAVTQQLGGTNEWDKRIGAASLRLLDICGLQRLREQGIEIGAHSRTHKMLSRLAIHQLQEEIAGSVEDLEAVGLGRPRFFSYPHGEFNTCVQQVVQEVGLQAAFTIDPGLVRPGQNPYQLPRIEILRGDVGWQFRWKVALAGRRLFSFNFPTSNKQRLLKFIRKYMVRD